MLTLLVTGATDGIGRETARELLANGRRVLVHGRTRERAERTIAALAREQPDSACDAVWADLSRMGEVVELAAQVRALAPALDVLINNAGVYEDHRELTEDGFERTMAVNHFAPFLLTHRLLPVLHAASAARVVTVSSIAHQSGQIDPDDLEFERGFSGYGAYAASKLANVLFTFELARRQADTRVSANCLHPGVIATKLLHKGFGVRGAAVTEGARTSVFLAIADAVAGKSGRYFVDCREAAPSPIARDALLAAKLWAVSARRLSPFL